MDTTQAATGQTVNLSEGRFFTYEEIGQLQRLAVLLARQSKSGPLKDQPVGVTDMVSGADGLLYGLGRAGCNTDLPETLKNKIGSSLVMTSDPDVYRVALAYEYAALVDLDDELLASAIRRAVRFYYHRLCMSLPPEVRPGLLAGDDDGA